MVTSVKGNKTTGYSILQRYKDDNGKKIQEYVKSVVNNERKILVFQSMKRIAKNACVGVFKDKDCIVFENANSEINISFRFTELNRVSTNYYVVFFLKNPVCKLFSIVDDEFIGCDNVKPIMQQHCYCNGELFLVSNFEVEAYELLLKQYKYAGDFCIADVVRNGLRQTILILKDSLKYFTLGDEDLYSHNFVSADNNGFSYLHDNTTDEDYVINDGRIYKFNKLQNCMVCDIKNSAGNSIGKTTVLIGCIKNNEFWAWKGKVAKCTNLIAQNNGFYKLVRDSDVVTLQELSSADVKSKNNEFLKKVLQTTDKSEKLWLAGDIILTRVNNELRVNGNTATVQVSGDKLSLNGKLVNCGSKISKSFKEVFDKTKIYKLHDVVVAGGLACEVNGEMRFERTDNCVSAKLITVNNAFYGEVSRSVNSFSQQCVKAFDDFRFAAKVRNQWRIYDTSGDLKMRAIGQYPILFANTPYAMSINTDGRFTLLYGAFAGSTLEITFDIVKILEDGFAFLDDITGYCHVLKLNSEFKEISMEEWFKLPYYDLFDAKKCYSDYSDIPTTYFLRDSSDSTVKQDTLVTMGEFK